ncbi:Protein ARV1 [Frankliniella fusca]|uniref:Protein ARV n=1 Tax=Frankliniella fusca TaxID=407009 RepID=A0AAE1GZC2_9NEOP|nr:Protein ARV1 [Frankliniella fusca]
MLPNAGVCWNMNVLQAQPQNLKTMSEKCSRACDVLRAGGAMEAPSPSPARCVHCGGRVPRLYRRYSPTVLKMVSCARCGRVADKYIEYDPVLVLLDLVLLNREAIRHILYNTAFRSHWKLYVVMVLIEGYVAYCSTAPVVAAPAAAPADPWPAGGGGPQLDALELHAERLFYVICIESLLASLAFFAASALGCRLLGVSVPARRLAKALVLGSFAVFLWLPALVWRPQGDPAAWGSRRWVDAAFIDGYTFLGLVQTVSVLCAAPRARAAVVAVLGLGAKAAARSLLRALDCEGPA